MVLKTIEICTLPYGAVKGIIPGGMITKKNAIRKEESFNFEFNKEDLTK